MAFACAVDPSEVSVPLKQAAEPELVDVLEVLPPGFVDLLLLQAASAVMAASTPAAAPRRVIFTIAAPFVD
jgi:hypothetical protein